MNMYIHVYRCRCLNFDAAMFADSCVFWTPSSKALVVYHLVNVGGGPFQDAVGINCKMFPSADYVA